MRKAKLLVEVTDFFVFGFKIVEVGMCQDKVQNQQPGADEFVGKAAAVAKIVLVDGSIEWGVRRGCRSGCDGRKSGIADVAHVREL